MPRRNRYEINYARIEALLGRKLADLQMGDCIRLKAPGFMDLVCETLWPCETTGATVLSFAHYFEQNGDLCQDPEMTVRLFHPGSTEHLAMVRSTHTQHGRAEALSYQQAIPPVYQVVYPEPDRYRPRLRRELNHFLGQWLQNLEQQGHRPSGPAH